MPVKSGRELGLLAETCNALNCHWDEEISRPAMDAAAAIFDYLRDYMDGSNDCSMTLKLSVYDELGKLLNALNEAGAMIHSALRPVQFVGDNWQDKTPVRMVVGYVMVDRAEKQIEEIWAAKRFQFA